jgi:hypothetical protein
VIMALLLRGLFLLISWFLLISMGRALRPG